MTSPPSGTVTMLFSDIEGSTLLLSRLGDRYAEALDGQRSILRDAWSRSGGHEMGTEGDSFFVVFERARDAAAAAIDAQRRLAPTSGRATNKYASGWACTPANRSPTATATSAWTCTAPPGSPESRTAGRWSSPTPPAG
jgi:hypothetical protein